MLKFIWLPLLLVFALSPVVVAKDKENSAGKALKHTVTEDSHPGKAKGRPENPGEHGRQNAAEKQSRGHGNGSKKMDVLEDEIPDGLGDDKKPKKEKKGDKDKKDKETNPS